MPNPPQDSGPILDKRFKLGKIIGRGPSGVVYAATDLQTNQPCAVKRLHAHFYNKQVLQKVQHDALAAAKLGHPSVLSPYHVAFEQSGSIYLVTHFVQGESLLTRLQRGPLSLTAALTLFDPLAAALQAAHESGLFHGSITPTNILCVSNSGRVLLTDFGMCHLRGTPKIKWGGAMGYAAPETFEEGAELCSARGDVFALGALVFECLTGQRMFSSTSLATFLASVATPPRLGSLLPMYDHLDAVLEMACAPEPLDRFANGGALWRALQSSLLDGPEGHDEPAAAPPPPGPPTPIAPFAPAEDAASWEAAAWEAAAATPTGPREHATPPPPEPARLPPEFKVNKHPVQAMSVIQMPVGESSDAIHPVPLPPPPALSTPVKGPIRVQDPTRDPLRTTLPQGIPGKLAAAAASAEPRKPETAAPATAPPRAHQTLQTQQPQQTPQAALQAQQATQQAAQQAALRTQQAAEQAAAESSRMRLPTPRLPQLSPAPLPPMPSSPSDEDAIAQVAAATPPAPARPAPAKPAPTKPEREHSEISAATTRPLAVVAQPMKPAPAPVQQAAARPAPPPQPAPKPAVPVVPPSVRRTDPGAGGPMAPPIAPPVTVEPAPAGLLPAIQPRPPMPPIAIASVSEPQQIVRAEASDSGLRARGRFTDRVLPPMFWATVGGFLVGGTLLFLQILSPGRAMVQVANTPGSIAPSLRFDEDALLKVTQQLMAQRNYQSALSAAELVLRAHPDNARARRMADQASDLLRASAVYGGFLRAADQQDADTAAALYAELPADSPFRVNAWEPFMPVRNMFVTRHQNLATAANNAGDCDLVAQQLDELRRVTDNERDPDFLQTQRMLTRCRRVYGNAPAAPSDPDETDVPSPPVAKAVEKGGDTAPEKGSEKTSDESAERGAEKLTAGLRDPFLKPGKTGSTLAQNDGTAEKPRKVRKKTPKTPGETGQAPSTTPPPERNLPSALRNPFGP